MARKMTPELHKKRKSAPSSLLRSLICKKTMRMWIVRPGRMCRSHLLGEHVELHMFVGTIRQGKSLSGYCKNGLVEVRSIRGRHRELAEEMRRRGYRHRSELPKFKIGNLPKVVRNYKIKRRASCMELMKRCPACRGLQYDSRQMKECTCTYHELLKVGFPPAAIRHHRNCRARAREQLKLFQYGKTN